MIVQRAVRVLPAWAAPAAVAGFALACCTVAGIADPTRPGSGLPSCPFKAVTGWGCPGCGATRMLHEVVHGDIVSAARYNIIGLLMMPVLAFMWVRWTQLSLGRRPLPMWRPSPRILWLGLVVWMAFSVLRNLPWEPFTGLKV